MASEISRDERLQAFINAAETAFNSACQDARSQQSLNLIFEALKVPGKTEDTGGERLPVCGFLDEALRRQTGQVALDRTLRAFREIEPLLRWGTRADPEGTANENFASGHANAMIIGPGGLEDRNDVWLGAMLLAPDVRYPDHDHAPEETYLVMSPGEFRQGDEEWFTPGVGGSFYNSPSIRHAVRSGHEPLFALWALRAE